MSGKRKLQATSGVACDAVVASQRFNLLAPEYEYMDPNPDIHALFMEYNQIFFDGGLAGCEVKWSKRMTLCAGLCSYQPSSGFCSIRLSEPLLKLRPRSDLINTLLHEMIHAYVFVRSPVRDHEDHGPVFQSHMHRINQTAGTVITVFHTFHDEVDSYRQHWWQCDGPCRREKPFFGLVKRAMNRPPGPLDRWWEDHQKACGGKYTKIKDPPGFKEKQEKKLLREQKKKEREKNKNPVSVKNFFPTANETDAAARKPPVDAGSLVPVKKPKIGAPKNGPPKGDGKKKPPLPPQDANPRGNASSGTGSQMTISVPESAVLVAGEDGEFYLLGDVSAMFQSSSQPRLHEGERGLVDLTQTDDDEDDGRPSSHRARASDPANQSDSKSAAVEIIEID